MSVYMALKVCDPCKWRQRYSTRTVNDTRVMKYIPRNDRLYVTKLSKIVLESGANQMWSFLVGIGLSLELIPALCFPFGAGVDAVREVGVLALDCVGRCHLVDQARYLVYIPSYRPRAARRFLSLTTAAKGVPNVPAQFPSPTTTRSPQRVLTLLS